ncbi:hypothetical protein [Neobacillus sp. PS2-9]|uniref:hypothetical protein n=1 Tax=Neobacillus sp. PS2-9 TaxID=3070676 RepID=UPI0027E0B7F1|nr:hypothetical protein [Neobacillus sp. PS2-9]WML56506.1 hypothetical protein RCG25_16395 [Neobacillus sp. PS2-9]
MENTLKSYLPKEVPDNLFTRNELKYMGLVPIEPKEPDALVNYTDQKREFNLYDIEKTREPKRQKGNGISLTIRDRALEDILKKRRRSIQN